MVSKSWFSSITVFSFILKKLEKLENSSIALYRFFKFHMLSVSHCYTYRLYRPNFICMYACIIHLINAEIEMLRRYIIYPRALIKQVVGPAEEATFLSSDGHSFLTARLLLRSTVGCSSSQMHPVFIPRCAGVLPPVSQWALENDEWAQETALETWNGWRFLNKGLRLALGMGMVTF